MKTLILNADLSPLSIVPVTRGLILALEDRVDVLEKKDKIWRSQRETFSLPSVVVTRKYVNIHSAKPTRTKRLLATGKSLKLDVMRRDAGVCQYCGAAAESVDHVVPKCKGGTDDWNNVVAACNQCNRRKGDKLLDNCGMKLKRSPRDPPPHVRHMKALGLSHAWMNQHDETWRKYLGRFMPEDACS